MLKRLSNVFLMLFLLLLVVGCSSESGDAGKNEKKEETITLKLSGQSPEDHPSTQSLNQFAEKVNKETNGRVEIKVFPANQLGDYTTVYKEVGQGTIDMAMITTPSEVDKRLDLLMMPYIATSYDGLVEKYKKGSFIFDTMEALNQEQGIKLLAIHANGFGGIGTTKEIENLTNIGQDKGILVRTPPMPVFSEPMKDLGFRTVTIPWSDLYTALQTGAADGWSGGEVSLHYHGFRDIIKYFYKTNDFFNADALYINNSTWEKISKEDQQIIEAAAEELMENSFKMVEENDRKYLELLEQEGIEIIELSADELNQFAEHVRMNTWSNLRDQMTDEIIDGLIESLE